MSSFFVARARSQQQERIDCNLDANKRHSSYKGGTNKLPDDILVNILSHVSLKEAARASVLARRWRYLWRFTHGTLRFDHGDTATGEEMEREKFESWVDTVVELHQGRYIEGMIISFGAGKQTTCRAFDSWVHFAMQKEVQRFEMNLLSDVGYEFPSVELLVSLSQGVVSSPFRCLRTLRLSYVDVNDEVVHYFLASCPNLEELCMHSSYSSENVRVVDPPRLRVLEINRCPCIWSLEISAVNLVSLTYGGRKNSLLLKKIPNLRELTISNGFCLSFVLQPKNHSSYSAQLEKLVLDFQLLNRTRLIVAPPYLPQLCSLKRLEVQVYAEVGQTLLFTSLIKASPHLRKFRIELSYLAHREIVTLDPRTVWFRSRRKPFPGIISEAGNFVHRNLKVVEMTGYVGCPGAEELLLSLISRCPSIESVAIDTWSDYYDGPLLDYYFAMGGRMRSNDDLGNIGATTRYEAIRRAKNWISNIPFARRKQIKFIIT